MFLSSSLRLLSIVFILLALARPQWGFFWGENKFQGFDILIALDTSKSMLADDIYPNRLEFSKNRIKNFINGLKNDRVGLIAFAGQAFLECPLTVDRGGVLLVLKALNTESIPRGGTSMAGAIEEAIRSYKDSAIGEKLLFIITDGENTTGDLDKAIEKAKDKGLVIICIGIGSLEGKHIYFLDDDGRNTVLKDREGNIVKSILDEKTLEKISSETGGIYIRATQEDFGLWNAYESFYDKLKKNTITDKVSKVYEERFQIFLVLALLLLISELLLERSSSKSKNRKK